MIAEERTYDYDYLVIGSGFGGSVSALRLSEKGYRVLVLEKGKRLTEKDFPTRNWNLRKWLWVPMLRFFGFFRITLFRHLTVLSGVGVGGGSLVYANALQVPPKEFFRSGSWAGLADWVQELKGHYETALKTLGATPNPRLEAGDRALEKLAGDAGKADRFGPTTVAVFFGEPDVTVPDPYFGGKGPARSGCNFCGGCMVGCRYNAKNTLDKNYLYLAERIGARVHAHREDCGGSHHPSYRKSTRIPRRELGREDADPAVHAYDRQHAPALGGWFGLRSAKDQGEAPTAFIPEAKTLAERYAKIVNGKPMVLLSETLLGIPTTAHILGGSVMGSNRDEGVIDAGNRVFGYPELYVCDGSMISANPGVNPSLTITAITERAMSGIEPKGAMGSAGRSESN